MELPEQPLHEQAPSLPPSVEALPRKSMLGLAAVFYAVLCAIGAGWMWWRVGADGIAAAFTGGDPGTAALYGGGIGVAAVLLTMMMSRWMSWASKLERVLGDVLGPVGFVDAVLLALMSGVGEEVFFRGALQPALQGWFGGAAGYVVASVVFGLVHAPIKRDLWPWTLMAMAMGFVLGWLYLATGNLLAPIACHVVINAINLWRITPTPTP